MDAPEGWIDRWGPVGAQALSANAMRMVYAIAAVIYSLHASPDTTPFMRGLIAGAVWADQASWLLWHILRIDRVVAEAAWGTALNVTIVIALNGSGVLGSAEGEVLAAGFLSAMLVLGLKIGWYGLQSICEDE